MVNKDITRENKQSSIIWGGRFNSKPSAIMEEINSSISFDKLFKDGNSSMHGGHQVAQKFRIVILIFSDFRYELKLI